MTSSSATASLRNQLLNVDAWLLVVALLLPPLILFPDTDKTSVPARLIFGLLGLASVCRTPAALGRAVRSWPLWLFLLYLVTALVSTVLNDFPDKSLRSLMLTGAVFMGFYAFSLRWPTYRQIPFVLCATTLAVTLVITSLLSGLLTPLGITLGNLPVWQEARFIGLPGLHPATLGWLCAILSVFTYTAASVCTSPLKRGGMLFLSLVLLFFLCLTWSRIYMVASFGLCGLFAFLHTRKDVLSLRLRALGLLLLPLVCVAAFYGASAQFQVVQQPPVPAVQEQPATDENEMTALKKRELVDTSSWFSRLYIWEAAWNAFLEKPWLGNGVNSTPLTHKKYWSSRAEHINSIVFEARVTHAHNYILQFLSEGGIIGLATMTAFLAVCLLSARNAPPFFWSALAFLGMSAMDLFMASRYQTTLSFALLGCMASFAHSSEDDSHDPT